VACLAAALSAHCVAGSIGHGTASSARFGRAHAASAAEVAIAAPYQPNATFVVKNCNDAGTDSLRAAVAASNMLGGDNSIEFDLNAMQCSTISLSTGQIDITTSNLTIGGSGPELLTIDGGYGEGHSNRIFKHAGFGTLFLDHMVLTDARYAPTSGQYASGGCVASNGTVSLNSTRVESCRVEASGAAQAAGGGVWGRGVKMTCSTVTNCGAVSLSHSAKGGGIYAGLAGFHSTDSTVSNNVAASYAVAPNSAGGGAIFRSDAILERTTVSGNVADKGGGLYSTASIAVVNSTITSNIANDLVGGVSADGSATIYSSTIAFNRASRQFEPVGVNAGSIYAMSSIIASNMYRYNGNDFELDVASADGQVSGAHNLIIASSATTLPLDTLTSCPRLAPLTDNGGPTRTHALLPGSPAIDAGDDAFSLGTDQRGAGFDRVVGAAADIGAYEWGPGSGNVINSSGFEKCE
jgi:hypothetical protein